MASIKSEYTEGDDCAEKKHVEGQESYQIVRSEELGENFFATRGKELLGFLLIFLATNFLLGCIVTFWVSHR